MVVQRISIYSSDFRNPVVKALEQGHQLAIWHQIPWSGGDHEWFHLHQLNGLDKILNRGRVASAFTVYEWLDVPLPLLVDQEWLSQATRVMEKDEPNHLLLLYSTQQENEPSVELVEFAFLDDLQEWAKAHVGSQVRVGRVPNLWTGEIVRGYYPDANGVPVSGPY